MPTGLSHMCDSPFESFNQRKRVAAGSTIIVRALWKASLARSSGTMPAFAVS
jgi:hypothetical protein